MTWTQWYPGVFANVCQKSPFWPSCLMLWEAPYHYCPFAQQQAFFFFIALSTFKLAIYLFMLFVCVCLLLLKWQFNKSRDLCFLHWCIPSIYNVPDTWQALNRHLFILKLNKKQEKFQAYGDWLLLHPASPGKATPSLLLVSLYSMQSGFIAICEFQVFQLLWLYNNPNLCHKTITVLLFWILCQGLDRAHWSWLFSVP